MPQQVCSGAQLTCSFGLSPSQFTVLPVNRISIGNIPAATIMDFQPMVNIMPFGMCTTPTNPQVAAATAAALGVLTPMPCIPVIMSPWAPGSLKIRISNQPALTNTCQCTCTWGGIITIVNPGQMKVTIP